MSALWNSHTLWTACDSATPPPLYNHACFTGREADAESRGFIPDMAACAPLSNVLTELIVCIRGTNQRLWTQAILISLQGQPGLFVIHLKMKRGLAWKHLAVVMTDYLPCKVFLQGRNIRALQCEASSRDSVKKCKLKLVWCLSRTCNVTCFTWKLTKFAE